MKIKDKHYINLKWITLIALPAISASVGLIGVSSVNYNKEK